MLFLHIVASPVSKSRHHSIEPTVEQISCKQPANLATNHKNFTYEDTKQLRLELVKARFLDTLPLGNSACQKNYTKVIPASIQMAIESHEAQFQMEDSDQEKESVYVFPQSSKFQCSPKAKACLLSYDFQLPKRTDDETLMYLWIYRTEMLSPDLLSIILPDSSEGVAESFPVWPSPLENATLGWVKLSIRNRTVVQLVYDRRHMTLEVNNSTIDDQDNLKPFLEIERVTYSSSSRSRRSVDCGLNSTRCCRKPLNISFSELNWDKEIVFPPYFNAYYCEGHCHHDFTLSDGRIHNAYVYAAAAKVGFFMCCIPDEMQPLSLLWYSASEDMIKKQIMNNMIVKSCRCG